MLYVCPPLRPTAGRVHPPPEGFKKKDDEGDGPRCGELSKLLVVPLFVEFLYSWEWEEIVLFLSFLAFVFVVSSRLGSAPN